jgi:hypothetical protein
MKIAEMSKPKQFIFVGGFVVGALVVGGICITLGTSRIVAFLAGVAFGTLYVLMWDMSGEAPWNHRK